MQQPWVRCSKRWSPCPIAFTGATSSLTTSISWARFLYKNRTSAVSLRSKLATSTSAHGAWGWRIFTSTVARLGHQTSSMEQKSRGRWMSLMSLSAALFAKVALRRERSRPQRGKNDAVQERREKESAAKQKQSEKRQQRSKWGRSVWWLSGLAPGSTGWLSVCYRRGDRGKFCWGAVVAPPPGKINMNRSSESK